MAHLAHKIFAIGIITDSLAKAYLVTRIVEGVYGVVVNSRWLNSANIARLHTILNAKTAQRIL
jgi:hypothetical protein